MQQYFDASMGKPGIEDILLSMRSDVESYYGRLGKAREFSQLETPMGRTRAAANNTDSVAYMFDDSSVVWVVFQQGSVVNSNTYEMARRAARNFLNNLNPPARWEGKIDGAESLNK